MDLPSENYDKARQSDDSRPLSEPVATDHGLSRLAATDRDMSRHVATDQDLSQYTLTIEQAFILFDDAGVGRDKRTIQRYCEHSKIDAMQIFGEFGPKWYLNPESVEGKIKKLQQFAEANKEAATTAPTSHDTEARHPNDNPPLSGPVAASRDESRQEDVVPQTVSQPVAPAGEVLHLQEENTRLKQENLDLKIDNRGLTKTVNSLVEESREFSRERREMQSERKTWMAQIGEMTSRLMQLSAGHDRPAPVPAEVIHTRVIEVDQKPPDNPQSGTPGVDNSSSEIIP